MQIQGDLIFLMAYFIVYFSPLESPAVSPIALTPYHHRQVRASGPESNVNQTYQISQLFEEQFTLLWSLLTFQESE